MKHKLLLLITLFVICVPSYAECVTIQRVIDGDTVVTEAGEHVRLAEIDAPEHNQRFGYESTQYLIHLLAVTDNVVELDRGDHDRYGRTIGFLNSKTIGCLNSLMVMDGYAWVYVKYAHDAGVWYRAENQAKFNHLGLWIDRNPVPPWTFRLMEKQHSPMLYRIKR